jgi:hypothetical protein
MRVYTATGDDTKLGGLRLAQTLKGDYHDYRNRRREGIYRERIDRQKDGIPLYRSSVGTHWDHANQPDTHTRWLVLSAGLSLPHTMPKRRCIMTDSVNDRIIIIGKTNVRIPREKPVINDTLKTTRVTEYLTRPEHVDLVDDDVRIIEVSGRHIKALALFRKHHRIEREIVSFESNHTEHDTEHAEDYWASQYCDDELSFVRKQVQVDRLIDDTKPEPFLTIGSEVRQCKISNRVSQWICEDCDDPLKQMFGSFKRLPVYGFRNGFQMKVGESKERYWFGKPVTDCVSLARKRNLHIERIRGERLDSAPSDWIQPVPAPGPFEHFDDTNWIVEPSHKYWVFVIPGYPKPVISRKANTRMLRLYAGKQFFNYSQRPVDVKNMEDFEGRGLFNHQSSVYGDISQSEDKIKLMSGSERDRFTFFKDERRILQRRHDEIPPEMNKPEAWTQELGCSLDQSVQLTECLKVIEPSNSIIKKEIMDELKSDPSPVAISTRIIELAEIAQILLDENTPDSDAMNYQEPYSEHLPLTEEEVEVERIEESFKHDRTSSLSEYVYYNVYDQGNWEPTLTDKEFIQLIAATASAETVTELGNLASGLFEDTDHIEPNEDGYKRRAYKRLTYEQSQVYWEMYNAQKAELSAVAENLGNTILQEFREKLRMCRTRGQVGFHGIWLFKQIAGEKLNGKRPDARYAYIDSRTKSKLWSAYNFTKTRLAQSA